MCENVSFCFCVKGVIGPQGDVGPQGEQGYPGLRGDSGESGVPGIQVTYISINFIRDERLCLHA